MSGAPARSVVMLIQSFYPAIGGAEKQALELSRSLVSRGVRVTVLTRQPGGLPAEEDMAGARVKRLRVFGPRAADSVLFMLKSFFWLLAHRAEYDTVHVHLASSHALAALLAGKITGKRTLIKLADGKEQNEITLSRGTALGRLKLLFFRLTRPRLMVLNSEVRDWLAGQPGFSGSQLILFRNGVDTLRYAPPLYNEKISAKARLGFDNSQLFMFVGRLDPKKRIKEFLELWAEIFSESGAAPRARLVIVGAGPEEEPVRAAIASLGLAGSVTLAGAQRDLLPYYQAADVFVLPSIAEGLSNSMLEAMACGLAVLASRVGGARDAIVPGVNGSLFDPLNRGEIKDCLRLFLADRGLAVRMGEGARRTAVEKYSMARVTDDLLRIYEGGA